MISICCPQSQCISDVCAASFLFSGSAPLCEHYCFTIQPFTSTVYRVFVYLSLQRQQTPKCFILWSHNVTWYSLVVESIIIWKLGTLCACTFGTTVQGAVTCSWDVT
jgi:hypothetical protein